MMRLYSCVILLCCVSMYLAEETQDPLPTSCSHSKDLGADDPRPHRVLRQVGESEGGDVDRGLGKDVSIGTFAAFPLYTVYYHLSKYLQGNRALEKNLYDLTGIMTCLEEEEFTPDLHLHCFFPFYFSRKESMRMSHKLWKFTGVLFEGDLVTPWADLPGQLVDVLRGVTSPSGPTLSPTANQDEEDVTSPGDSDDDNDNEPGQRKSQDWSSEEIPFPSGPTLSSTASHGVRGDDDDIQDIQDIQGLTELTATEEEAKEGVNSTSSCNHRVKRQFNGGDIISILSIAVFAAFLFYVLYYHITKYLQGRSLDSYGMEDHLREMTRILQCLEDEDFVPRLECFVGSKN
ncbi:uncharacterized protein LOC122249218 [Penaeus japonicus]|uniref:uncharacterized protein LOC122249218 n=1 Tax=Penaeus japonicus TaxID=27405 RepID=UPI001C70D254|nr:uncharacterized protein LOC122249218 [Penaeus japonicus]